jgi:hypothetical protein
VVRVQPEPKPITQEEAFQHFAYLYVRYIQVFRKLEDCYDQCVHPQKRRDIKLSLDTVCGGASDELWDDCIGLMEVSCLCVSENMFHVCLCSDSH